MNPKNKKPLDERTHYTWQAARPELKAFVAKVIRETRLARDQNVNQMAKELGIAYTTIYRWERGDIGGTPAILLYWLFKAHDGNESMDPLYWRERALMAEDALSRIREQLDDHKENTREMFNGNGKP